MRRHALGLVLLGSLCAVGTGCVKSQTVTNASGGGGWLLMQAPSDPMDPDAPPIEKWRRVKSFATLDACEDYREDILQSGEETGSDALLEEAKYMRCVDEKKVAPGATTTTPP